MIPNLSLLKNKKVLFAEDDIIMRDQMSEVLSMLFKKVFIAKDGKEAYSLYEEETPDLIITDIKMPIVDGLAFIEKVRHRNYDIPIILLTNYSEKDYLVHAANLSIDGYILKPVEFNLLTKTILKAMKRLHEKEEIISLNNELFYNVVTQELYKKGVIVPLGGKELALLKLLIKNRPKTITKEEISEELWPLECICESAIKNLILRIRKKLSTDIIMSVRGVGYRLIIEDKK